MSTVKKSKEKSAADQLTTEYYQLIGNNRNTFMVPMEWRGEGDTIQQFSMYENYTPVKTSGDTTYVS